MRESCKPARRIAQCQQAADHLKRRPVFSDISLSHVILQTHHSCGTANQELCMHRQAKSTYAQDHTAMVQLKAFLKVSCRHTISCGSVSHIQHRDNTCIHVQNRGQSCKDGHTSLCIQSVTPHRRAPDKMLSSHPDKHFAICCLATVDLIQASTHVQGLSERLSE